jgi:ATP-dependent Lon protease
MPQTMPLVPLRDLVVFPGTTFQFVIGRPRSLRALDVASRRENRVFLAVQRDKSIDDPGPVMSSLSAASVTSSRG